MRAVNGLVTTGRPARPLAEERGVVAAANDNHAGSCLLLEVALQTEVGVALHQHLIVRRAVRIVAGGAAFADGFVLENKGPALSGVALNASIAFGGHRRAAALDALAFVRIVAVAAGDFAVLNGMMMRGGKAGLHVQVTGHAGF